MKKFSNLKSINEATDREMLNYIFATQLQILRRIDFLEMELTKKQANSHEITTKEMIDKIDDFTERINEQLNAKG